MLDLARDKGFKELVATRGTDALALAQAISARRAISLDIFLPDMLGWTRAESSEARPADPPHPSADHQLDDDRHHGLARGAFSFVTKPTTTEGVEAPSTRIKEYVYAAAQRLLVVEDNPAEQLSISELLGHDDVEIEPPAPARRHSTPCARKSVDCVVLDLRLPDMSGFEVLERIRQDERCRDVPVVVFTGRELHAEEDARLHTMARSIVVKGVESPERLLDETALFLHRVVTDLPPEKQRMLERLAQFRRRPCRTERSCWSTMTRAISSL